MRPILPFAALLLATALSTGCAKRERVTAFDAKAPEPSADPAMAYRAFAPTSATYESTTVVAWSTRSPIVVDPDLDLHARPVVEPMIFVGNLILLPASFIVEPPLRNQIPWRRGGVDSTYSGVPPLDEVAKPAKGPILPWRPEDEVSAAIRQRTRDPEPATSDIPPAPLPTPITEPVPAPSPNPEPASPSVTVEPAPAPSPAPATQP